MTSHSSAEKVLQDPSTGLREQSRERVHVLQISRDTGLRDIRALCFDNGGRTLLRLHQRHHLLEPNDGLVAEPRIHHIRTNRGELDSIDTIAQQLLLERLHLSTNGEFSSTVRNQVLESNQTSHGGQGDNVSLVLVCHVPSKGLHSPQMSIDIDLVHLPDLCLRLTVQCLARHDSGIVDQDRDKAHLRLDLLVQLQDLFAVRDVATGEEMGREKSIQ